MKKVSKSTLNKKKRVNKNILKLSCLEARSFLLKGKSYCRIDLPKYFEFDRLIEKVSKKLKGKHLKSFYSQTSKLDENGEIQTDDEGNEKKCPDSPRNYDGVNYKLLNNKNGKYAWRPLQLIHPALYVSLVYKITEEKNWKIIKKRFEKFASKKKIKCISLPIRSDTKETDKATMVSHWWHEVEQKSIELALDYQYLFVTDISDCYGSLYTHSVAWALHGKNDAKKKRYDKNLIGNVIDGYLQDMSFGQTNGIPQGSVLMDFIAEMVLGYADWQLSEKIGESIKQYKIIRYRDDYRVFVNNPQDGEAIIKSITEVLIDLGMKLNPQKTTSSDEVVKDSLKEDKRYWIDHKRAGESLQKHLLVIHSLSQKYPNSGSLDIALNDFMKRINKLNKTQDNIVVLVSILTDIALKNPRTYPISSAILSELINLFRVFSKKICIIKKIKKRFEKIPNTGHLELWLQRITYKLDDQIKYNENLCKIVAGQKANIWNSDWLKHEFKSIINPKKVINKRVLDKIAPVIEIDEVELFKGYS